MTNFKELGIGLRSFAKLIVINFMQSSEVCQSGKEGMKQTQIFKECGFDWVDYDRANSTRQQYWVVALLRELESEGKIERVSESGPWRLP